jgi:hypothetical protein
MAQSPSSNDPYASIGSAPAADPYAAIGVTEVDPYAEVGVSPYSAEGIAAQRQALVESQAGLRRRREEADAAALLPKVGIGIRAPFGGDEIARFDLPPELVAFGSEAIKSSPATAAGVAAASAATPLASRVGMIPGPVGAVGRFGIPLVSGGVAAIGTRLAQDELLPQILPQSLEDAYGRSAQLAVDSPTAAMLGQFAGAAPFFRPGLPVGVDGSARLAVPAITGVIGGGIEGAQQLADGDLDVQRLALAAAGSAMMNRETALGARIGPNLVATNARAGLAPSELNIVGQTLREPLPDAGMAATNQILPTELASMGQIRAEAEAAQGAARDAGERSVANLDAGIDAEKVRRLGERMAGKSPQDQLSILDQEMRLQKDNLSLAEQRAGLDMKIELKRQIDAQKAMEAAAKAEQDAVKEQQAALEQAKAGLEAANQPPEIPKSQQILQDAATPPPLANIATEVATQTKQSPYALQGAINKMTETAPPTGIAALPPATLAEPVNIGPRDATVSTGDGVPTAKEKKMLKEQQEEVDAYLAKQATPIKPLNAPVPTMNTVDDVLKFKNQNIAEEVALYQREIGLTKEEAARLQSLMARDRGTEKFQKTLTPEKSAKVDQFFDESEFNKKGGPFQFWEHDKSFYPESIDVDDDTPSLARGIIQALGFRDVPLNPRSDRAAYIALAAKELERRGASLKDIALELDQYTTRNAGSQSSKEEAFRSIGKRMNDFLSAVGVSLPLESKPKGAAPRAIAEPPPPANPADQGAPEAANPKAVFARSVMSALSDEDAFLNASPEVLQAIDKIPSELKNALIQADNQSKSMARSRELLDEDIVAELSKVNKPPKKYAEAVKWLRKFSPTESPAPVTQELRLNNAGIDLPPVSSLTADQKLAELQAAGVRTYNGKPISEANGAQLSNALGKWRRGQLERGAVSAKALTPIAGAGAGGLTGAALTERQPGETEEEFQRRRLRNAALGTAYGGAGGASLNALGSAAVSARAAQRTRVGGQRVPSPEVGPDQGIRRTAEKVLENPSYPEQMQRVLADDPEIVYEKISRNRIRDLTKGATDEELVQMLSSPDPNIRIGALIQQANRASVTPGMEAEAARLVREVSKNFTSPAQLLGMGSLVESPKAMVQAVEDALNLGAGAKGKVKTMTDAVKKRLFELSERNIKAEQAYAKAQRAARDELNDATAAALKTAEGELGASKKALADYTKDILPEDIGQITSKIIKGNLLGPLSFAKNMFGNAVWQTALRGSESIATALDAVYSRTTGKPRSIMLGNPVPRADELRALADGVRVASKELLTGPSEQSYIKTEVQRGFHPIRAMAQVFSGVPAADKFMEARGIASLPRNADTGKVSNLDRGKKLLEATFGIAPEASFRMLNMGDKPVRLMTESRLLNEAADLKGLTGVERQRFIALPDEATVNRIEGEGRSGIMAQRNPLAQKVGKIFDSWMVDVAENLGATDVPGLKEFNKITGTLQFPFREFPANFANTALNFAMPPIALARGGVQSIKGNRREAMKNFGEAVMGLMAYAAADYLWENGLISPPLDPRDKKRRQAQYEIGASRVNVSGIERLKNGEDPTYRRGDTTMDWTTIGPMAAPLYVYTRRRALEEAKASRTGDDVQVPKLAGAMMDASGAANFAFDQSFLSGTSAFIDALQDWETFGDRFTQNTFRAITAIPVPATAESLAKTEYKFIPEMKGDSLGETLGNVWDFKVMELPQDARSNLKRDMWGEALSRTPDGRNPYLYQFLDVTRAETKAADPFKQALLELYQKTNSTDVYPALVNDTLSLGGPGGTTTVELYANDYDDLQQLVGAYRKQFAQQVVANPRFNAPETIPEAKILALADAYSEGAKAGKQAFLSQPAAKERYPELFGLPSVPGKSRVVSRDAKARGRLRMERESTPVQP